MKIGSIGSSGPSSAAEEARETRAQTQIEARNGDQQAAQLLARLNAQKAPQAAQTPSPRDTSSQGRALNAKA